MKKIIAAIAGLALMASTAYAAEWNFYGSARVSTFWYDTDVDGGKDPSTMFDEGLQSNARIGANVKVSDELTGRFEYGAGGSGETANIRLLYGEWDFGEGKLLVGKDYVPCYLPGSNQVVYNDAALEGFGGEMWGARQSQIKLTFGGFQIAIIENDTNYVKYDSQGGTVTGADGFSGSTDDEVSVVVPMIQAQYALTIDNWVFTMAGGYQTFDVDYGSLDDDVTSWGLGLDVAVTFGAFDITAQVNGGSNVGNMWLIQTTGFDSDVNAAGRGYAAVLDDDKIYDNDAIGGRICVGYTINEMFGVEVGYGYQQTKYDINGVGIDEIESQSYYINFPITLAPGVHIVPEVGVVDFTKDDLGEGQEDITYFGAKWQINF